MVDYNSIYDVFLVGSFLFIIEEFLILMILKRDDAGWHFTFGTVKGHGNLRPVVSTFKVALILFSIILLISPLVGLLFFDPLSTSLRSLQYSLLLLLSAFAGALFFIWHYIVGKKWNAGQVVTLAFFGIFLLALIYVNYGMQKQA